MQTEQSDLRNNFFLTFGSAYVAPFSPHGGADRELSAILQSTNEKNVQTVQHVACNGLSRCLIVDSKPDRVGISTLGETKAVCTHQSGLRITPAKDDKEYHRYTGQCKSDDIASTFLVECWSSTKDYIEVQYFPDVATFQAFGNAKAAFSKDRIDSPTRYQQRQTSHKKKMDLHLLCP